MESRDIVLKLFAATRLVAALLGLIAVAATFADTGSRTAINPFNFFGFFTMQSNILAAVIFLTAAIWGLTGRERSAGLELARGCATAYMIIVGLVYNLLLAGLPGGVDLPWANNVLHIVIPIYAAVDWLFFADRSALPWNRFWVVVVYPMVWVVVVLIRGATDGWVPYPFLDPATGYGAVALYAVGIAVGIAAFGALVWAVSRVRILDPGSDGRADVRVVPQRNRTGSPGV
ncbi:MAG: Pr6Pr family membrane protein [Burkholderiaceae bacterium]|nr:Pr6Pr family membrane protein [Microbacteriaceae bacterium]